MRLFIPFSGLIAFASLSGCVCKDVPVERRLADCTNSTLRFQMIVQDFPPYQFVLGMPQGATSQLSFRGEVVVSQSTGTVARVLIGSDAMTYRAIGWTDILATFLRGIAPIAQRDLRVFSHEDRDTMSRFDFPSRHRQRAHSGCRLWGELVYDRDG